MLSKAVLIKKYLNQTIIDTIDNIKFEGKKLLKFKLEYIDIINKDTDKHFRIFGTNYAIGLLNSKEITQYFTEFSYKFLPTELHNINALLILIRYNANFDKNSN